MSAFTSVPCRIDFRVLPVTTLTDAAGRLETLSTTGCTIRTRHHLPPDAALELRIYLPDGQWPLRVDRAQVIDHQRERITVSFLQLSVQERDRLHEYLGISPSVSCQ